MKWVAVIVLLLAVSASAHHRQGHQAPPHPAFKEYEFTCSQILQRALIHQRNAHFAWKVKAPALFRQEAEQLWYHFYLYQWSCKNI